MKKIIKALLVVSLAAAANVAVANNSEFQSDGRDLAGFPAIQQGTGRSSADEHQNDRVLLGDAVFASGDSEVAGFYPIPGGAAWSYADAYGKDLCPARPAFSEGQDDIGDSSIPICFISDPRMA